MSGQGDSCLSCWHQEVNRSEIHGRGVFREGGWMKTKDQDGELRATRRWGRSSRGRSKGSQQVQTKSKGRGGSFHIVSRCLRKPSWNVAICYEQEARVENDAEIGRSKSTPAPQWKLGGRGRETVRGNTKSSIRDAVVVLYPPSLLPSNAGSASALRALGMLNRRREAQGMWKFSITLDLGSHLHR